MAHCTRCEIDVQPWSELDGLTGRMVDACPRCQTPIAPSPAKGAPRPVDALSATPRLATHSTAPGASCDVVALARARRDVLRALLAERDAYQRELDVLEAMLVAAERTERDESQADAVTAEYAARAKRRRDPSAFKPH